MNINFGCSINITEQQRKIVGGKAFVLNHIFEDVPAGETRYLKFDTNDYNAHIIILIESEGKSIFNTYANSTYTDVGTVKSGFNRKTSGGTHDADININPTIDDIGDKRGDRLILGGTRGQTTGATGGDPLISDIDKNTSFLISLTNVASSSKDIGLVLDWHETDF